MVSSIMQILMGKYFRRYNRQISKLGAKRRLLSIFSFVAITMYTFILSTVVQPFNCSRQPNGSYTINKAPSEKCFEGNWKSYEWIIYFFAIFYGFIFPFGIGYIFYSNRNTFNSSEFIFRFGTLISPYKKKLFFWELVIMLKRGIFVVSNDILSSSNDYNSRYFTSIGLLLVFLWIDVAFAPFQVKEINLLNQTYF